MVDTHAHLLLCGPESAHEVAETALAAGVEKILSVGLDDESNAATAAIAGEVETVFACVGRHPNEATGFDSAAEEDLRSLCGKEGVVAVGETGLDLYREGAAIEDQRRAFLAQIAIARDHSLPLVIHLRDREGSDEVLDEAFATLEDQGSGLTVVLHCFSAGIEWAERAWANGWFCSFAGNLTYPSARGLREVARATPDDLLLVETDAPFLAPQPFRGKSNRPANVVATAQVLADERGIDLEELDGIVTANAERSFAW